MEKSIATRAGKFIFRPYENSDEPALLGLWGAAFKQKMSPEIWRWKYHQNPFGRKMIVCTAESGQPVALYAGIPFPANLDGSDIHLIHLTDNMSHPDFRFPVAGRQGIFGQTVRHFISTIGQSGKIMSGYGFPGSRHFRLGYLQFSYLKLTAGAEYLQCSPEKIRCRKSSILRGIRRAPHSGDGFSRLQHEIRKFYPLAAIRNEKFIHWRFFTHPTVQYKVFTTTSVFGNLKSYAALRIDGEVATLVDIFVQDSVNEMCALLSGIADELLLAGCNLIRTWLPANHFTASLMKNSGFSASPEPLGIVPATTIYNPALHFRTIDDKLFYTMGDGDLF